MECGSKFGADVGINRRALRDIKNFMGAAPPGSHTISGRELQKQVAEALKSHQTCSLVNDELKEVDMEDAVADLVMDIDREDADDPFAVVDYVKEIYAFYRETEGSGCVCPNYMSNQVDINEKMRAILIDWLIEVHYKFDLMEETLFLTVNIIDRFLARQTVMRKKLQLVGVTAMLLACKYEEVSVPVVDDLIIISDRAYTRAEILEMERLMVNMLQFNMSAPTPYVFMRRFLKAAASDKQLELLSSFIVELCLVEYEMLQFPPSLLAAAAVYTAQCSVRGLKLWTRTSELYSSYSEDHLLECSRKMVGFHQRAEGGKLTGVHRKYNTFRYGYAARSEPASFLLEAGPPS
ncbi:unnamed protein product [Spirodela intermedia]|uniref:Uncharacterized protein n=1 Tax=Spirodela intermedia TaxID=51605 RepID=A0A7I8IE18_SPIIN|nr:unnamed protein product [Spirodela intermedia]CAA6655871.1 unnamed protein product [Spirodela intermedia]